MNPPKVNEYDYINFLIAAQKSYSDPIWIVKRDSGALFTQPFPFTNHLGLLYSCSEAERVQPVSENATAHDTITRLLHRMKPSSKQLWQEAQAQVQLHQGIRVVDDSTLDHLYAKKMELVTRHWSGKHGQVVQGINRITLLWTEGNRHIPLDYRLYEKSVDGGTKNDHFRLKSCTILTRIRRSDWSGQMA